MYQAIAPELRGEACVSVLNQAPGANESLQGVAAKIRSVDRELREKISAVERMNYVFGLAAAAMVTFLITQAGLWVLNTYFQRPAFQRPGYSSASARETPAAPSQGRAKEQPSAPQAPATAPALKLPPPPLQTAAKQQP
jgi:hypothetical protein